MRTELCPGLGCPCPIGRSRTVGFMPTSLFVAGVVEAVHIANPPPPPPPFFLVRVTKHERLRFIL